MRFCLLVGLLVSLSMPADARAKKKALRFDPNSPVVSVPALRVTDGGALVFARVSRDVGLEVRDDGATSKQFSVLLTGAVLPSATNGLPIRAEGFGSVVEKIQLSAVPEGVLLSVNLTAPCSSSASLKPQARGVVVQVEFEAEAAEPPPKN